MNKELQDFYKQRGQEGDFGEYIFRSHLKSKGWTINDITKIPGYELTDYDISAQQSNSQPTTFEVKTNYREYHIGHRHPMTIIETATWIWEKDIKEWQNKLSGLSITKADYYVLYYPFEELFYIERTQTIRSWLTTGEYHRRISGGRNKNATMYQIDRKQWHNPKRLSFMDYHTDNSDYIEKQDWWNWWNKKTKQL